MKKVNFLNVLALITLSLLIWRTIGLHNEVRVKKLEIEGLNLEIKSIKDETKTRLAVIPNYENDKEVVNKRFKEYQEEINKRFNDYYKIQKEVRKLRVKQASNKATEDDVTKKLNELENIVSNYDSTDNELLRGKDWELVLFSPLPMLIDDINNTVNIGVVDGQGKHIALLYFNYNTENKMFFLREIDKTTDFVNEADIYNEVADKYLYASPQ